MAKYFSHSRKVYGALMVVMFLISVMESANCENFKTSSLSAEGNTAVRAEVELPDARNTEVQAAQIGSVKTVARRGSTGRTSGVSTACASLPSYLASVVVVVVANIAGLLS